MTLQTWKEEFYPKEPTSRLTKKQAIKHSLRKWEGLRKPNLEKHDVYVSSSCLYGNNSEGVLVIDASSCSLCVKYYAKGYEFGKMGSCVKCPLAQSLGNSCDKRGRNRPYSKWIDTGNPLPMIRALRKLVEEK